MKRRPRAKTARYRIFARRAMVLVILFSVVLLFTWNYIRTALLTTFVGVVRGETGTLSDSVSGEAIFAGGSVLLTAPGPGTLTFLVQSGETVRMGQVIGEVGSPATADAFEKSLAYAKNTLETYVASTEEEFQALMARLEPAYDESVRLFFEAQDLYAKGYVKPARLLEDELSATSLALRSDRTRLLELEAERARLSANVDAITAAMQNSTVQVLSPIAGTFIADFSEVESKLSPDVLASKDASQLLTLIREAKDARKVSVKDGQTVAAGDLIGRVVTGQNIVFYLPIKTENRPLGGGAGRSVDLNFTATGTHESGVISAVEDGKPPGYSVISGKLDAVTYERMVRAAQVSLVLRSRSGILIPKKAIMVKDGVTGVLTVQKTYARFTVVEVLMENGDRAVVKGINAGDEVVSRALGFLEGKRVR